MPTVLVRSLFTYHPKHKINELNTLHFPELGSYLVPELRDDVLELVEFWNHWLGGDFSVDTVVTTSYKNLGKVVEHGVLLLTGPPGTDNPYG